MIVTLKDDVKYKLEENILILYLPTKGTYRFENVTKEFKNKFYKLLEGCELTQALPVLEPLLSLDLIKEKITKNDEFTNRSTSWIANFGLDGLNKYKKLKNKKVLILGVGGVGSIVFQQLLQLGMKKLFIVDYSKVNLSDLNRQSIYSKSDLNKEKVSCCKEYACREFDNNGIQTYNQRIEKKSHLSYLIEHIEPGLIFCCIDEPLGYKQMVISATLNINVSVLFCEVGVFEAFVGPLLITNENKNKFLDFNNECLQGSIAVTNSSICFSNNISASFMTQIGFNYLCGFDDLIENDIVRVDFINMDIKKISYDAKK